MLPSINFRNLYLFCYVLLKIYSAVLSEALKVLCKVNLICFVFLAFWYVFEHFLLFSKFFLGYSA